MADEKQGCTKDREGLVNATLEAVDEINNVTTAIMLRVELLQGKPVQNRVGNELNPIIQLCQRLGQITRKLQELADRFRSQL